MTKTQSPLHTCRGIYLSARYI